ncbi:MAG: hypothetical protein ACNYPD_05390 [Candidatus Halichondribacter symbioticus]
MTLSLTPSLTLPIKKSIPTLVLLVAILVLSGCVGKAIDSAIDRATNSATNFVKNAFPGIDVDNIDGFDDLAPNDPCLQGNAVFNNPLCTGATNKKTYDGLREARCVIDSSDAELCGATIERVCVDIDHALCTDEIYVQRRKVRDDSLEEARLEVVFGDWRDGVTNTTPSNTHTGNQFLSGLSGVLGAVRTTQAVRDSGLSSPEQAAEFSVTDGNSSGGLTFGLKRGRTTNPDNSEIRPAYDIFKGSDENDGVVFVAGQYTPTGCVNRACAIHRYYAGLLPSTDLGEPLTAAPAQGTWKGQIQSVGEVVLNSAFDINFTFNTTTNGGTIEAYVVNGANALRIDGVFDDQGVLTGSTQWGSTGQNRQVGNPSGGLISPGTLRGLIGQEGAVAAFISDETGIQSSGTPNAAGYAGGFVAYLTNPLPIETCITAKTCVDYTHWTDVGVGNPATTPTANRFLTGTPTGLTTGGEVNPIVQSTTLADSDGPNPLGGEATNGFAIFQAGSTHNAGILSTTRLGAPLRETTTNAVWKGLFSDRVGRDARNSNSLTLMVSYSGTSGTIMSDRIGRNNAYTFTNVIFNNVGIITGTITRTEDTSVGTVTGLIGADGAVAVFHSNTDAGTSYVGGFVAVPPEAEPES